MLNWYFRIIVKSTVILQNYPRITMKLLAPSLLFASLALTPALSFAADAAQPAKPDLTKGEASFTTVCVACHGPDANSLIAANPTLAQQHPEYLIKQITEFKSGKRANPIMMGMASTLPTEDDVRNVAYYIASKPAKPGTAKDKDLVAQGERIYRGGAADRQIAACAGCHSPNGAGIPAQYPRLAGQQSEYVIAQLTAFREGTRQNSAQMAQEVAKLNDKEIKALAEFISGLH